VYRIKKLRKAAKVQRALEPYRKKKYASKAMSGVTAASEI
jgi:hypothetical protein